MNFFYLATLTESYTIRPDTSFRILNSEQCAMNKVEENN